jgi:hypothetical protein
MSRSRARIQALLIGIPEEIDVALPRAVEHWRDFQSTIGRQFPGMTIITSVRGPVYEPDGAETPIRKLPG